MPTTKARARKLLKAKVAEPVWSKFGTFGIQLLTNTSEHVQNVSLGVDNGTKFEGYSVASENENLLNVKLNLPEKWKIKEKLEKRRILRRTRRQRKTRRRPARFNNRSRKYFIAPSQLVVVRSRIKIITELFKIYPVSLVGLEDVCFNHAKHKKGKNFSTVEIGKNKIREFIRERAKLFEFKGYETKELREKYGYQKISDKSSDSFESHNCDSLSLAIEVNGGSRLEPLKPIVVDDTYRPVRRSLHKQLPNKGGTRKEYSKGTVFGLRKGKLVGHKGQKYLLTGVYKNMYRITDMFSQAKDKRNQVSKFDFISSNFLSR